MDVLYICGPSGPAASEYAIMRGLSAAGVRALPVNYKTTSQSSLRELVRGYADQVEAILVQNGVGYEASIAAAIHNAGLPIVFYATEAPTAARHNLFIDLLPRAALTVLAHDHRVQAHAEAHNVAVQPFAHGYDAAHYKALDVEPDVDVVFVGHLNERRQEFLRAVQQRTPGLKWFVSATPDPAEVCRRYHQGRLILHVHATVNIDYLPTRVFESLPCRPPIVVEGQGANVWYPPTLDRACIPRFDLADPAMCADVIEDVLDNADEVSAAQQAAAPHNTWEARARLIADVLRRLR